ncbi:MAG: menaquinone biosynthesis protein [Candidatus Korobacteraceae bacterium]|jgi:chorismate dehydratase
MRPLKISAISFLNTAPLMWNFEHDPTPELAANFAIDYHVPSQCVEALRAGSADIGIVPVITYASIPDLVVIPRVTIAARGEVRSILLISKVPIEQIASVAVDNSSRTSVALTQVLLTRFFGGRRELISMSPELAPMLARCDAALIIGDPALQISIAPPSTPASQTSGLLGTPPKAAGLYCYDLAQVWFEHTGKPFVFAVWAVRHRALEEMRPGLRLAEIFQQSRDAGLQPESLERISCDWSRRLRLAPEEIHSYLTRNIYYELDQPCLEGLQLFFDYAAQCGAAPQAPALRFIS